LNQIEYLRKTNPSAAEAIGVLLSGDGLDTSDYRGQSDYSQRQGYRDSDMYGRDDRYGYSGGYGHSGGYNHGDIGFDDPYGGFGSYDGGYGHSGGYGDSSYKMAVQIDPYLVIGSIGAAATLAFIAYRILVTTEAGGGGGGAPRRRSFNDLIHMELSDVPSFVSSIHNLLQSSDDKHNSTAGLTTLDGADDPQDYSDELAQGINSLWWARTSSADACVRCSLFDYIQKHPYFGDEIADNLIMASIAYILEAEQPGQLLDEFNTQWLEGDNVTCEMFHNTCHIT
ncbi:unnamed protein product, partial [Meganyctiphanes norvegica]